MRDWCSECKFYTIWLGKEPCNICKFDINDNEPSLFISNNKKSDKTTCSKRYYNKRAVDSGIEDSGNRTEFSTGAVRDIHEGKGRFDLLPMNAVWEVAKHCEKGALKYGERNVDKGIPQHSLIDSGIRHIVKYILGYTDEKHLVAACWNLLWALEQEKTHPELNDLSNR